MRFFPFVKEKGEKNEKVDFSVIGDEICFRQFRRHFISNHSQFPGPEDCGIWKQPRRLYRSLDCHDTGTIYAFAVWLRCGGNNEATQ